MDSTLAGSSPDDSTEGGGKRFKASALSTRVNAGLKNSPTVTCIRMEVKPGNKVLQTLYRNRPRATLLGLAVRKAWDRLPEIFPEIILVEMKMQSLSIEGFFTFTNPSQNVPLIDIVLGFKRLCQENFTGLKMKPSELWVPGFIESKPHSKNQGQEPEA